MSKLKGTKTEKNLHDAFAGESMARNKYTYFAKVAKKEGYEQIAALFLETAENERVHAKAHFKHLSGISNTVDNLTAAAAGENYEHTDMYPRMAKEAREEGFEEIARSFENIARAEIAHETRYKKLIENIKKGKVFKKDQEVQWKCLKCGYIHEGEKPPAKCPTCSHPENYFEVFCENY